MLFSYEISCSFSFGNTCEEVHRNALKNRRTPQNLNECFLRIFSLFLWMYFSCGSSNPKETITHKGITWKTKSAGNLFPMQFLPKFAGDSAGKSRTSSSERCVYTTFKSSCGFFFLSTVSCYHYTIRAVDADLRFCSSFASLVLFFNLPVNVSRAMHLGCCLFL